MRTLIYQSEDNQIYYDPNNNLRCCRCDDKTAYFILAPYSTVGWHYKCWIESYCTKYKIDWAIEAAAEMQKFLKQYPELVVELLEE